MAENRELEKKIRDLLSKMGAVTGSQLWDAVGGEGLALWRTCRLSGQISVRTVGCRYLRLDRRLKNFVRLSPSIFREFLTYSVVSLSNDRESLEKKARELTGHIERVSRSKQELVYRSVCGLLNSLDSETPVEEQACFILAGDIVYNMAHDVPRPERSTGKMVNGSDMDMVVVVDDPGRTGLIKRLDDAIFKEKYRLLTAPHIREEIDYVVKDMETVEEQVKFDNFSRMVACKILQEGTLLFGNEELFSRVKGLIRDTGVLLKLEQLERKAKDFRKFSEEYLLTEDTDRMNRESLIYFYPTEESEEFE